jgi:SepF-like predicted cell division protein (DUF552 family)
VKCVYCGFKNNYVEVCGKCGKRLRRYVKKMEFHSSADLAKISEELGFGNFVFVDLYTSWFGEQKSPTSPEKALKVFSDLERVAVDAGGDFVEMGEGIFALAPSPFKVWKQYSQLSKSQKFVSKRGESQFRQCPYCGASVKDINFDDHVSRVHHASAESQEEMPEEKETPSAGTLARFYAKHSEQADKILAEAEKIIEQDESIGDFSSIAEADVFAARAVETGRYKEILLALERLKDEVGGQQVDSLVRDMQLEVMCSWKKGFEEEAAGAFFGAACKICPRTDKEESQCKEGYSNCMYDEQFEEFENDAIAKLVERLKKEVEPKESKAPEDSKKNG